MSLRPCHACGETARLVRRFTKSGYTLVGCRTCGLGYVHEIPPAAELEQLYGEGFFRVGHKFDEGPGGERVGAMNARQRIARLGWVRSATVTRLLPDTIRIEIAEREPFALWQRGGELSLIDAEGRPITDEGVQDFAHLPFIVGFGAPHQTHL